MPMRTHRMWHVACSVTNSIVAYGGVACATDVPARLRQVVRGLAARLEVGVAPSLPLECERDLGGDRSASVQYAGQRWPRTSEPSGCLGHRQAALLNAFYPDGFPGMGRIRHRLHNVVVVHSTLSMYLNRLRMTSIASGFESTRIARRPSS